MWRIHGSLQQKVQRAFNERDSPRKHQSHRNEQPLAQRLLRRFVERGEPGISILKETKAEYGKPG